MAYRIILASASPRRKELLEQVGAEFEIIPAVGEEIITDSSPQQAVLDLAAQKAAEVAAKVREDAIILGADTVVAFGDKILGKPKNEADAKQMLSLLSGKTHSVYTGVSIVVRQSGESQSYSFYEETEVTMYPLSEQQILSYIRTKEPMDKAGSYGIQGKGAVFIEKIQGDYNNVVGLPIARVFRTLEEVCGFSVMVREIYH
ncbi:MAG: septum formation inhibitor Maf [Lachnospiraceae bacterium]|jgi:MAF protein|nr:septum formation inhibitor Maf [Lachnospiraceae bacterium]